MDEEEHKLRPLKCELFALSRPDGSAMLIQGDTAVLAAMYGPVEVKAQKMSIEKASVEAVYRPKVGVPRIADKTREELIRNTCEISLMATLHPRTSVVVILQEMQDSGGLLSCALNAGCLALINSGISMKFLIAAVNCMINKDDAVILDPDNKQLKESKATLMFVFDNVQKNVVACHTSGMFSQTQFHECLLKCREASDIVFAFYRNIVNQYANVV
ncbi:exosome complex component RRP46 [Bacillus rossius redtenbacheri]|uniref:exosome complex component RRP46 n=1 Tax=Bacillus rossius redtenbacheri TaxID=93214 RepID=UPI002FDCC8D2